jgi:hypothetical protein
VALNVTYAVPKFGSEWVESGHGATTAIRSLLAHLCHLMIDFAAMHDEEFVRRGNKPGEQCTGARPPRASD